MSSPQPSLKKRKLEEEEEKVNIKLENNDDDHHFEDDVESLVSVTQDLDDSDSDEGDDISEPDWDRAEDRHDAEDLAIEPNPDCAAYRDSFQGSAKILQDILTTFPEIDDAAGHDKRLEYLQGYVERAKVMKQPDPLVIAFLGNAGKGKTSTQNSLLDKNLAQTASLGSACTNVVCEFRGPLQTQQMAFAAEVVWHGQDRMKFILDTLAKHYIRWAFEHDVEWTRDERIDAKREHNSAVELFRIMFCANAEFASTPAVHEWFKRTHSLSKDEIVTKLMSMALAIMRKHNDEHTSHFEAPTGSGLRKLLVPFMVQQELRRKEGREQSPSFWPLIEVVRIGMKDTRLLTCMTLSDLPGRSVQNSLHAMTVDQYLHHCHGAWIFTDMTRVLDDNSLFEMLEETFEKHPVQDVPNIAVVCTHSDDHVDDSLLALLASKKGVDLKACKRVDKKLKAVQKTLTELKSKTTSFKVHNPHSYQDSVTEQEGKLARLKTERYNLLVLARNLYISSALKDKYQYLVPAGSSLNVFCVSNSEYQKLKRPEEERSVNLDPATTGIPALRSFGLRRSAINIETASIHSVNLVKALANATGMWINKAKVDNPERLLEAAARPQQDIEPAVKECFTLIHGAFKKEILDLLEKLVDEFEAAARSSHEKWVPKKSQTKSKSTSKAVQKVWAWGSYMAWCCRCGVHKSKARGGRFSWNEEFLRPIREKTQNCWGNVEAAIIGRFDGLTKKVDTLLEEACSAVAGTLLPGAADFDDLIKNQSVAIGNILKTEKERQLRFVLDTRTRMWRQQADNFLCQILPPTYEKCKTVKGGGSGLRMREIMQTRLNQTGEESMFTELIESVSGAFDRSARSNRIALVDAVEAVFKAVHGGLKIMLDTEEDASDDD